MKKISKNKLDSLIEVKREYWKYGGLQWIDIAIEISKNISNDIYGDEYNWHGICNFVDGIVTCIAPDADNQTIYNALQLFGWDVVE